MNTKILRLEGLVAFLLALALYFKFNGNWLIFVLLILVPDVSIAGYLKNNKIGALAYNLVHNLASPFY
ncbi:MAG: hypothetical protein UU15_C0030G0005 [Candidatus Levybacteria bacterium GW2011_GWC2_40_7]|nr:MAG: hypothetical protein UU15_C0030G0005 [Candidatus Levybacteria bacterium GW2011_GWC2_40_7]